jgi:hypothetical protein
MIIKVIVLRETILVLSIKIAKTMKGLKLLPELGIMNRTIGAIE